MVSKEKYDELLDLLIHEMSLAEVNKEGYFESIALADWFRENEPEKYYEIMGEK